LEQKENLFLLCPKATKLYYVMAPWLSLALRPKEQEYVALAFSEGKL
jgi:hypothetical protein